MPSRRGSGEGGTDAAADAAALDAAGGVAAGGSRPDRTAWEKLFATLAYLRGDPKLESLLIEKHLELHELICGPALPKRLTADSPELLKWFERKLKKKKDLPQVRASLCAKLMEKVRHRTAGWRMAETARIEEALRENHAEEGPLVCCALAKELEGTRFDGLWICREGPGMYRLGDERLKVAVQVLDGRLLVHGYFEGDLLHPVRVAIAPFLAEHGPKDLRSATDADCDLFGGAGAAPAAGGRQRSRSPRRGGVSEETLPPGWARKESRSKPGVFYYANEAKGLTQFERPTE